MASDSDDDNFLSSCDEESAALVVAVPAAVAAVPRPPLVRTRKSSNVVKATSSCMSRSLNAAKARSARSHKRSNTLLSGQAAALEEAVNRSIVRSNMHLQRDRTGRVKLHVLRPRGAKLQLQGFGKRNKAFRAISNGVVILHRISKATCRYSPQRMIQIAFERNTHKASARVNEASAKTIRRIITFVGAIVLMSQWSMVERCLNQLPSLDYACSFLSWDETGERVTHPDYGSQVFHIFVCKVVLLWGCCLQQSAAMSVEFLMPPMLLPSTSADSIWNAMMFNPVMKRIRDIRALLSSRATYNWVIHTIDKASGNLRLEAHELNVMDKAVFKDTMYCCSHQNHLIHGSLFGAVFGLSLLNDVYACALFFRMGCHFMRFTTSVSAYLAVGSNICILRGAPPEVDQMLVQELKDYLKVNLGAEVKATKAGSPGGSVVWQAVEQYFDVFNAGLHRNDGVLVHYCRGPLCCRSPAETKDKMRTAILQFPFRSMPVIPSTGKWTKTAPAMDNQMTRNMFGMMYHLLVFSMQKFNLEAKANSPGDDLTETAEFDWHKTAGKRYIRAKACLGPERRSIVARFVVAFEPIRILCLFFLAISGRPDRSKPPALFDLLWPRQSVLQAVLQYYSALLRGTASRLILVWRQDGCSDLRSWIAMYPQRAFEFRRACRLSAAAVYRRHCVPMRKWAPLCLGDNRRPAEEKNDIAAHLLSKHSCCLEPGSWRRVTRDHVKLAHPLSFQMQDSDGIATFFEPHHHQSTKCRFGLFLNCYIFKVWLF